MIKDLINLANKLDQKGFRKEADYLDKIIRKISSEEDSNGKIKTLIQRIKGGLTKAVSPETGEGVEPEQAISELESMENLVNEMPDKRALGFASFKDMSNLGQAMRSASIKARRALSHKISSETLDGVTVSQASFGTKQIDSALMHDQSTGEYTFYIVLEIQ